MSKAIYGHLGSSDALLVAEVSRLRRRVRELEEQLATYEAMVPSDLAGLEQVDVTLRELPADAPALA
jgi:DNA invertase Pin-like site-specific DNA recombinase